MRSTIHIELLDADKMDNIEDVFKCPVCQDTFTDPVTLPCGHNFCLTCIQAINNSLHAKVKDFTTSNGPLREIQKPDRESKPTPPTISCDHCIELPSVAIRTCLTCDASLCQAHAQLHQKRPVLREHTLVEVTEDPLSLKCREHHNELKLFCLEHKVPVCYLCILVGLHKNHKTAKLHDAYADYKNLLQITMNQLLKRRGEAEHAIKDLNALYTQTLRSSAHFRERVSEKYSRIRIVLDGDERLMMQIIDAEDAHMLEWLEAQRDTLEAQIKDIDILRSSSKLLLQEKNGLQFLQKITALKLCDPSTLAPIKEVDKDLCDPEKLRTVERLVDELSVALSQHFPRMWSHLSSPALDSSTAHPKVEITHDCRQVYWKRQPSSDIQPYDSQYSVLAKTSFFAGQHYWEVIVQDKPYWLIGVTTRTEDEKANESQISSNLGVNSTSWCIYHRDGEYLACHDAQEKQLSVGKGVRKLGIHVNLQKRELSFYNADSMTLLHSFCVQCTKPLFPMLNPCIDVNGLNKQPLTLLWITDP